MKFLKRWKIRILLFLAVVGPGFITANVDNDAGGIWTYSAAGAQFGHMLLWTMIPITVALIVVQEMAARMGAVTGKGLSDLIREEFGFRITFFMMIGILITSISATWSRSLPALPAAWNCSGSRKYITVPICCVIVWLIVVKGQYKTRGESVPRRFVFLPHLHRRRIAGQARVGRCADGDRQAAAASACLQQGYLYMVIGVVGTTIAPWMQFYLQASIVEKGVTRRQYKASRLDVIAGCIFTDIVAWFIIVACAATLYVHGYRNIRTRKTRRRRCVPWRATTPTFFSPWDCSMHRCSPRRFCRSPRPTQSAKAWASSREWEGSSARRRSSTGSTRS